MTAEREALREAAVALLRDMDLVWMWLANEPRRELGEARERLRAALAAEAAPPSGETLDEPVTDADIERWYAAFEKVSGLEAATFAGRAQIYWRFVAALSTPEPINPHPYADELDLGGSE